MRYVERLLQELKEVCADRRPGQTIPRPKLLQTMTIQDRTLSYLEVGLGQRGKKPALIFIHGFGGFFMDWLRIAVPLSHHYNAYIPDLPGWGFSEGRHDGEGMIDDVRVIKEFIEKKNLEEVILVGISYGGAVAWGCAAEKIPQVKKLLLLNPMPPFPLKHMGSILYKAIFHFNNYAWLAKIGQMFLSRREYRRVCLETVKHKRLIATFYLDVGHRMIRQPKVARTFYLFARSAHYLDWGSWEDRLRGVKIPVTIMHGEDDIIFPRASSKHLQTLMPHAKLLSLKDCGHAVVFDQHRRVTAYLRRELMKNEVLSHYSGL